MENDPPHTNSAQSPNDAKTQTKVRIIKKYGNRRLYDTQTSSYITLETVRDMVLNQESFIIIDAKTEEDITRSVLLQIILDAEQNNEALFSTHMLEQLIRTYRHSMQDITQNYLAHHLDILSTLQKDCLENAQKIYGGHITKDIWQKWLSENQDQVQKNLYQLMNNWQQEFTKNWQTWTQPLWSWFQVKK